ncbi:MAG: hypothetical protein ACE5IR_09945 [bacterium]
MDVIKSKIRKMAVIPFIAGFLISACGNQVINPADQSRIEINNDEKKLNNRVKYFDDEAIHLYSLDLSTNLDHVAKKHGFAIKLRAEVEPPEVNGFVVHASHVTLDNRRAYVSYSTVNTDYRGGVEIFDILRLNRPRILSQALFLDTDVSIAARFEGKLYLGGATDSHHSSNFRSPACLEVITLRNSVLTDESQRADLPSFNANDIACFDSTIFVTSGTTDGALSLFDLHSLNLSEQIKIPGAKAVAAHKNYIVVMEGTGTNLHLFNRSDRSFFKTIPIGCPNFFQSKAEIEIVENRVFLSAGECGVKVVDLNKETIESGIPAPEGGQTNAVSVDGDLMFMANGKNGLVMAKIKRSGFEILGRAKFAGSTNFVLARDNHVFVANGRGGLKILEIVR